jgi:lysophospholipase L1-like esterase
MIRAPTPGSLFLKSLLLAGSTVNVVVMLGTGTGHGVDIRGRIAQVAVIGLFALAAAALIPSGATAAGPDSGPVRLAGYGSHWKALLPIRLPLRSAGLEVHGSLSIDAPQRSWTTRWRFDSHAGRIRLGDQRQKFTFVKGIAVPAAVARAVLRHPAASSVSTSVDYELPSVDPASVQGAGFSSAQAGVPRAPAGYCETLPRVLASPAAGKTRRITLPACGRKLNWRLSEQPGKGRVVRRGGVLVYRASGRPGADEIVIDGYLKGRLTARQRIQVRLGAEAPSKLSVVALGDSVTAGFGYFGSTGKQMGLIQLLKCRPGATVFNDACSSNSTNTDSSVGSKPNYLPDFGLSRNISWAAQWANQYGITEYENYAVTGSAPTDWLPGGQFNSTLNSIEAQDPDYILMTMGANPLLSDVLFGIDNMGCALESHIFGDFRQCVLDAFASVDLDQHLNDLYTSLVENTTSRIVVMQYHLAIPSSALAYSSSQLEMMTELLNGIIADEASQVSTSRITVISPPRFDVGIDMSPQYPSNFSCSYFGYKVDGPSVQSTPTQDELLVNHPLSFCSGPAVGPPWIISGDTGIHPSAAGYMHMASQVPAPGS